MARAASGSAAGVDLPRQSAWEAAGLEARALLEANTVVVAVSVAACLLALACLACALLGRGRLGARATQALLLGGGVAFPLVTIAVLWLATAGRARLAEAPPAGAWVVSVTGHMWWWEVRYRDPASGREVVSANELHLPAGRRVHLSLASADVIHAFWVPALGGKIDMIPGRITHLAYTPERPGTWRGQCAEFCGEQHARMALTVTVHEPAAFERWLAREAADAAPPATPVQARGREAFLANGCAACHTVRGTAARPDGAGPLGPDLTHVGSRRMLGAATQPGGEAGLRRWVADVQALKPGARMPSFGHLDAATLDALAAYLAHLE